MFKYFMAILYGVMCSSFIEGFSELIHGNRQGIILIAISFYVVAREYMIGGVFYKGQKK